MDDQPRSFDDLLAIVDQAFEDATPAPWKPGHVATRADIEFMNVLASAWPLFKNRMGALEGQIMRLHRNQSEMASRLDDAETRAFLQDYMGKSGSLG